MKKYIVKSDYNTGLMFVNAENAMDALEATPVRSRDFNLKSWSIDDRDMYLIVIDDSNLIAEPEKED